ncbi:ABC transporter [Alcanivorax hongdengensis A-11-3]|uniref:Transport permease protein n=1 Tax=Alcanivorax hongdengensis A-11-3 TaxID=1177179 RepID=L0WE20_9GAMM|nr:ABC transporter permease [Alcanivorax hongdengensis]EKF74387.1 ABC transporter [Alcanivorax hongdengensis A-11-3]
MTGFNLRRLLAVVFKEISQLRRDRLTYAMIIGIPTMQLILFGYAINLDVRGLPAAVVDQAQTSHSRQLLDELRQSQVLDFRDTLPTPASANRALESGDVKVAVVIPADFEQRLARPGRPVIQVLVDGSDQVVQQAARQMSQFPVREFLSGQAIATPTPQVQVATYYNPQRDAPLNTVPGLIGVILTMTMVMFTAIALVREREHGNQEFLITTPLSSAELTIGKVLPFVAIGLVQTTLILMLGYFIFDVPVRGSLLDLYASALVFIVATLSLGIFISTFVSSQFQAMQAAIFTFLPQLLLSGFMFPYEGMPKLAQWIAEVLPLTHFVRLVRGIMLRGASFGDLWVDLVALAVFALVAMVVATLRVHKRLD